MGNCLGAPNPNHRGEHASSSSGEDVAIGRNRRLNTSAPQWDSEERMTMEEVQAKRAEFWETSPAFEGRNEIWEALRAACEAYEKGDFGLAQAIVDGANISLPRGTLAEAYDELGNRYIIPNFCLAYPPGMGRASQGTIHSTVEEVGPASTKKANEAATPPDSPPGADKVTLKIRLSTLKDVKVSARSTDTVATVKQKLGQMEGFDGTKVRIFLTGKTLVDSSTVGSLKIPKGFLLQAHVPA